ncbi:MAG: Mut7-C ubiquitin/RNAse domain-containing protein [Actinomycetota bacterium]|nr:Mut7-C ubiquitin/RNAse domain-containing protein [Actinomycetota bacterium]
MLVVRLARELWLFAAPRRRREYVDVPYDGDASLGHVVQALGVPLTEVGALLVNCVPVDPAYRPRAGATVEVRPVARPQRVPRSTGFLLDVHLGTLARRLRVLGVDTVYCNDADDDALLHQAAKQQRVLLTQDRGLLMRRALWAGAYVRGRRPGEQLADVLDRFTPRLDPWTRCTCCNGELVSVPKHEVAHQLKPGTRRCYDSFARCRACGQVYWHGAHSRRLDAIVRAARSVGVTRCS